MYAENFINANIFITKAENIFVIMLQIHQLIEAERIKANLTQEEIAGKLKIKRTTYQYWEKKTPSTGKIRAVAKVLDLPEDYFFGIRQEPEPEKPNNSSSEPDIKSIMALQNSLLQTQNRILAEIKDGLQSKVDDTHKKVDNIETSLKEHRGVVNSVSLQVDSMGTELLMSLGRIEKKDEKFLLQRVDKRIKQKMIEMSKRGNEPVEGR